MINTPKFTIVFTDSGLGGLSSLGKFYHFLKDTTTCSHAEIDLLFFNALPQSGKGYSKMRTEEEKVSTFNGALNALQERYNPDIIAIACNTLSALYPKTTFSKNNQHVIEIISSGRLQISQHLQKVSQQPLLILATATTLDSGAYSFDSDYIIPVSGGNLASLIEANFKDKAVYDRVREMLIKVRDKIYNKNDISIFLGCTHYGYIKEIYHKLCQDYNFSINEILDPQDAFINLLKTKIRKENQLTHEKTKINLRIESQAVIEPYEIESIGALLQDNYPEIADLLKNYTPLPKVF